MPALTLYQFEISPFCEKIRKALDYKQVPYAKTEVSLVDRRFLIPKTGGTKVPVIQCGDQWIAESSRICRWLDERFPPNPLCPSDAHTEAFNAVIEDWADEALAKTLMPTKWLRGRNSYAIMEQSQQNYPRSFAMTALHFVVRLVLMREFRHKAKLVGRQRLPAAFAKHLDLLDGLIGHQNFIFGEKPFAADFAAYGMLKKLYGLEGFEVVEKRENVMRMMRLVDVIPSTGTSSW